VGGVHTFARRNCERRGGDTAFFHAGDRSPRLSGDVSGRAKTSRRTASARDGCAESAEALARILETKALTAPTMVPRTVQVVHDEMEAPDLGVGVIGGVPGGDSGGALGGIIGGIGSGAKPAPPPPSAKVPRIVRVGGLVKAPRELYKPEPVYSPIARTAHVEGVVTIDALIDEHGDVVQAHAIDGPALLIPSALAAVVKWKYEPTYLDGDPVSIRMHVEVSFRLR